MVPEIELNNGVLIPQLGFGTYKLSAAEARDAVQAALDTGYRHIDTAQMYRNEAAIGQAIISSGIPRVEVFVTTKLNNAYHQYDDALAAFDRSLTELQMDYVDLFLIHWPLPMYDRYVEAWRALEAIYASGRARAIGVSNFQPAHIDRILEVGAVAPMLNQIELHPYLTQVPLQQYDDDHQIVTGAWSPLGRGRVLSDPTIAAIAQRHGAAPSQVIIRWHLQQGRVVIPKSSHPARIAENFDVFWFELTPSELATIDNLNQNLRTGSHPDLENRLDR